MSAAATETRPASAEEPVTAPPHRPFRTIGDRILICPEPEPKRLIWIPEDPKKRTRVGVIVSMGEGMKVAGRGTVHYGRRVRTWQGPVDALGYNRWPMPDVKIGSRVIYLTWSLHNIMIGKIEHHLVRDTAIEGVFEEEERDAEAHAAATS
ncbi:MAG: co-chaperone GroES family protein [Thermoanaerobaculia bacterium]